MSYKIQRFVRPGALVCLLALSSLAAQATPFVQDLKIGAMLMDNSGSANELAALEQLSGVNDLVLDPKVEGGYIQALLNPGTLDQWVIDVNPNKPGYFLLKFGFPSFTTATHNTFFFKNMGELDKLVFSNADVEYLSGGNCSTGNDASCNIGRLSHYVFSQDIVSDGIVNTSGSAVPDPGGFALAALAVGTMLLGRRLRQRRAAALTER